jgi:hypothetical protein
MGGVPCVCKLVGVNLRRESTTSRKHGMLDIRLGWDGMGWDGMGEIGEVRRGCIYNLKCE